MGASTLVLMRGIYECAADLDAEDPPLISIENLGAPAAVNQPMGLMKSAYESLQADPEDGTPA
jgi:hypothetical protein